MGSVTSLLSCSQSDTMEVVTEQMLEHLKGLAYDKGISRKSADMMSYSVHMIRILNVMSDEKIRIYMCFKELLANESRYRRLPKNEINAPFDEEVKKYDARLNSAGIFTIFRGLVACIFSLGIAVIVLACSLAESSDSGRRLFYIDTELLGSLRYLYVKVAWIRGHI
jgi:hypothetical protein